MVTPVAFLGPSMCIRTSYFKIGTLCSYNLTSSVYKREGQQMSQRGMILLMLCVAVLSGCVADGENRWALPSPPSREVQKVEAAQEQPPEVRKLQREPITIQRLRQKIEQGEEPVAVQKLRQEAEQGDALAQFELSLAYALGEGVPQDYIKAAEWYQPAAIHGKTDVLFEVGLQYANGQKVPQDSVKASQLFQQAADEWHRHMINFFN
jgi:hypothetical protein